MFAITEKRVIGEVAKALDNAGWLVPGGQCLASGLNGTEGAQESHRPLLSQWLKSGFDFAGQPSGAEHARPEARHSLARQALPSGKDKGNSLGRSVSGWQDTS